MCRAKPEPEHSFSKALMDRANPQHTWQDMGSGESREPAPAGGESSLSPNHSDDPFADRASRAFVLSCFRDFVQS